MAAMLMRNALVLGILAPAALVSAGIAFGAMLIVCTVLVLSSIRHKEQQASAPAAASFTLELPFSLWVTLKYGTFFIILQIIGNVAAQLGGEGAFYFVSFAGGLASSASSLAAAANLAANGIVSPETAGLGAVIATVTSALVNLPFIMRLRHNTLTARLGIATVIIAAVGILGGGIGIWLPPEWSTHLIAAFVRWQ